MKWLVTGGCGFIGRSLVADLVAEGGHTVRVLDNLVVGQRESLGAVAAFRESSASELAPMAQDGDVELVVGDILDTDVTQRAADGADIIIHLAANTGVAPSVEDPRYDCLVNVIGTFNLLEAARHQQVRRFVFASSGAPVGEVNPPIHEDLAPRPVSPYGASKLAGEGYCSAYFRTFGIVTVALRFGNVYGPRSDHKASVVAKFIRRALAGEALEIYGDGGQTRDFIYVDDLVRAIRLAAIAQSVGGEVFQIAGNTETPITELARRLLHVLTAAGVRSVDVCHGPRRPGDVYRNFSDISKAQRKLGWSALVGLEEGLHRTVSSYLDQVAANSSSKL